MPVQVNGLIYLLLFGALLHFNASVMILNGVDVKTVQTCLGHSAATTTMQIYLHSFQEAQARAMDSVADCIYGSHSTDNNPDKKPA